MRPRGVTLAARSTAVAVLFALVLSLWTAVAAAFHPPPLKGHVVDSAGALTADEARRLDAKLDAARVQAGFAVVVFIPASLEGESIEDVSYTTAKTWGVGEKGRDDGVLLVIAPQERKIRIETGKGVGGALTDLECHHIIRDTIGPRMKEGKTFAAVDEGTDRILSALRSGPSVEGSAPAAPAASKRGEKASGGFIVRLTVIACVAFFILVIVILWRVVPDGGGDSSWSSTASSWSLTDDSSSSSYSSSDSSSSSYSGGGGDFGGGGASGDY